MDISTRLARIENGRILELFYFEEDDQIAGITELYPNSTFEVVPDTVERGSKWPIESKPVEPTEVAPIEVPKPSRSQVLEQLDQMVSKAKADYLTKWPSSSTGDLWTLFNEELGELWGLGVTTSIAWPKFPSLRSAIALQQNCKPEDVLNEEVRAFAEFLANKKATHTQELLRLETAYRAVVAAYDQNPELDYIAAIKTAIEG